MIPTFVLTVVLGSLQATHTSNQPLVSATETSFLSCTTWTGKAWTDPTPRSAQTPVVESVKGLLAYAEVKIVVEGGSCENTTTLYVASKADRRFKSVYKVTKGGNGIRLIGWAPDGTKLLAETNLWEYNTDRGYAHVAVLYDASTDSAREIPELTQALLRHFGPDCEFEHALQAWGNSEQVLVRVSKSAEDESYEQHFCVQHTHIYVFDLQNKTLKLYQGQRSKTN